MTEAYSGVAGDRTPAFVERTKLATSFVPRPRSVAGDRTPAFVERPEQQAANDEAEACRWGSNPGLR